jgi:hypothetical protein
VPNTPYSLSVSHEDILPPAMTSSAQRIFFNKPVTPNALYEAGEVNKEILYHNNFLAHKET